MSPAAMRLLHTSDWHLGASYDGLSLLPDHERFLDWLIDALVAWEVDALLVAGDVFDQAHPSAEAQRAFFRFLARLRGTGHRCSVVLTGGNHDSARRLRAPGDLLDALDIHVHAHLPPDGTLDPLLVPLPDAAAPQAVIAAVPYVHEYRLGVRTMDHAEGGLHAAITAAFADLYGRLAERARARWGPDVPLVAMGHLTVGGGADPADSPHAIHQAGSIEALPPSLFGDAWASIVLGHIHRAYPVDASRRCWYSGTPVALTPREGETARRVRVLDLCAGGAEAPAEVPGLEPSPGTSAGGAVNRAGGEERARSWEAVPGGWLCQRTVTVPAWRTMRVVSGTEEEVVAAVRGAAWAGELSPVVVVRVAVEAYDPQLEERVRLALAGEGAPVVARVVQDRVGGGGAEEAEALPSLEGLSVEEAFRVLYRMRRGGETVPEPLMMAFREVSGAAGGAEDVGGGSGEG